MVYLVFLFGLLFGSFFNVCIHRIPRNESIVIKGSHCTKCGRTIGPKDLIPVLSYIMLGGKCRYCKNRIPMRYPVVELITGVLYASIFMRFGLTLESAAFIVLVSIIVIVTFIDIDYKIIPDSLVIIGLIAGVIFRIFGLGNSIIEGLVGMLSGSGILLLISIIAYLILKREGMGGGDIKLMAMVGMFLGWKLTLLALLLSIYAGGLVAILVLILKIKKFRESIAYGPFIALGTIIILFYGNEILEWYFSFI